MRKYFLIEAVRLLQIQINMLANFMAEIKHKEVSSGSNLLNERLTNNMYDLKKQIQVSCDHVIYGLCRILKVNIDTKLDLSRGVVLGLEKKIQEAQKLLTNFIENIEVVNQDEPIIFTKDSREFHFKNAINYFEDWIIPNTYFHAIIAYAILRKSGVNIGKANYLSAKNVQSAIYENLEELPFGGKIYNAIKDPLCQN